MGENVIFLILGYWNAEYNNAHANFFRYATLVKEGV